MPPRKDIYKDGVNTQFSRQNQPENRGRKPSALRFIRGPDGLSITDIRRIINSLIWEYDSAELEELLKTVEVEVEVKDENGNKKKETKKKLIDPVPMGVNLVLGALADDQKQKSIYNFKALMSIVHGKPTQNVDINATGTLASLALTPEERKKRIEELLKKIEPEKSNRKRTGRTSKPA